MVKIITLLRCSFGAKQENGPWRIRYKYELYEIFNEPNIVNYIKVKRLAWAGHLVRMNDDRTLKKIFNTKPDGARSGGRPKLRWEDCVDQDMKILGVRTGRKSPSTETNGHSFLRRPGPSRGFRANDDGEKSLRSFLCTFISS
jgi:hypothetical protein